MNGNMNDPSLQLLLSRFTTQQLVAMVNAQTAANAGAAAQPHAQNLTGTDTQVQIQAEPGGQNSGMGQNQGVTTSSAKGKKKRAKKAKLSNVAENSNNNTQANNTTKSKKATRPLNSFMAFRSYYSKIFKGFPQKNISGHITALWRADPFQAKWAILAKGFSEIRDVKGKSDALLTEFLDINAPLLRIIEPERYLMALGGEVALGAEAQIVLYREQGFAVASVGKDLLTTNVSVAEIIENCYQHGYIARDAVAAMPNSNGQVMIMASSAQPAMPVNSMGNNLAPADDNDNLSSQDQHMSDDGTEHISDTGLADHKDGTAEADENSSASVFIDMSSTFGTSDRQLSQDGAKVVDHTQITMFNNPAADIGFNTLDGHIGTYPHNLAFDPLSTNDGYMFDPFHGHRFDAFNLSDVNLLSLEDWMQTPTAFGTELDDDLFNL